MLKQSKNYIIMTPDDNCATALKDILKGSQIKIRECSIIINQNIHLGHKIAIEDIRKGDLVKKYGHPIGIATEDIKKGDWIHIHNLTSQYLKEVLKI
ncbi:MAG: UxaA family hydrolase [Candidatus Lokiarchaeota archaeon]|nr:UxaA family hydrolase [Candidatus Lokiarchaeota archaeon]